jgi:hypothetical protein
MRAFTSVAIASLMVLLSGCSTPKVALDQANNTAGLVAQLEIELQEFRRVQNGIAERTKKSIRELEVGALQSSSEIEASMRARRAAEDPVVPKMFDTVRQLADGIGTDKSALDAGAAAVDDRLAKLLKPLPSTNQKTTEIQGQLAAMGTELSNKERLDELRTFYKTVKDGVDANRKKIDDEEAKVKDAQKKIDDAANK